MHRTRQPNAAHLPEIAQRSTTIEPVANSVKDSLIGQLVDGRYLVRERVARGGMATVYRATDKRLDRSVALKIMHPHLAEGTSGQNFVARFRREARAAARVTHAGLVAVYDQGVDGDISYLTLEYVEGSDLRRLLEQRGTLPLAQALAITEDILDALAAAHRSHLVHRDVKPENVLLSTDNEVKITDFGLARAVTEVTSTTTGTILGTVAYLAPELVTTGIGDTRADIYSVGIMLYEMITGRQPFTGEAPIHVAFQHVNSDVPLVSQTVTWVPQIIDELVRHFTSRDPAARPAHAGEALQQLRAAIAQVDPQIRAKRAIPPVPVPQPSEPTHSAMSQTDTPVPPTAPKSADSHSANTPLRNPETESESTAPLDFDDAVLLEYDSATNYVAAPPKATDSSGSKDAEVDALLNATREAGAQAVRTSGSVDSARSPQSVNETIPLTVRNSGTTVALPLGPHVFSGVSPTTAHSALEPAQQGSAPATTKQKPRRRKKRALLLTMLFLILGSGAGYGGWYWWQNIGPGSYVDVPLAIVDVPKDESLAQFQGIDLTTSLTEEYNDTVAAGNVISASPAAGERVKKESTVELVVSLGIKEIKVPTKLTGKPVGQVTSSLTEAGFSNVVPNKVYDTKVEKNTVMAVSVKEGTTLPHNTEIKLTVSDGPEPITIPQVVTMNKDKAVDTLKKEELTVKTKEVFHDTAAKGEVIEQTPAQGTSGHRGDTVTITVSKGREQVVVPNVVGMSTEQATAELKAAGLVPKEDKYMGGLLDRVRFQGEKAGDKVDKGSTVSITIW